MTRKTLKSIVSLSLLLLLATLIIPAYGQQQGESAPVRFAIISDRTGGHVPGIYGQIVSEVKRLRPDFVMTVGDMIEGYNDDTLQMLTEWQEYDSLIRPITCPIYFTPGNHDIWSDISEEFYRRHAGKPFYSFDRQDLHLIILDASRWNDADQLPEKQLEWLADDLQKNQSALHTLVFYHKPFWYESTAQGKPDTLHSLFVKYGVDVVFTGHYHEYFSGEYDGVTYTSVGSSGGGIGQTSTDLQFHFAWVTVDSEGIHIAPIRMNSVLAWDFVGAKDKFAFDRLKHFALSFKSALPLTDDLRPAAATVEVVVDNSFSEFPTDDTLRWEIPDGWQVEPQVMPVMVQAGEVKSFSFEVDVSDSLYPVPEVFVGITHAKEMKAQLSADLKLARQAFCNEVKGTVDIDGRITETFWRDPVTHFFAYDGKTSLTDPVEFYFCHDEKNLYIAARCRETKMDSLVARVTEHDGAVYAEDCIGFFFEPLFGSGVAYQIYFNPLGTAFDQKLTLGEDGWMDGDHGWNGKYQVATATGKDFWSVEARIPLEQFGISELSADKWRLNFRRKQKRLNETANWQIPIDYNPNTFGWLIMK